MSSKSHNSPGFQPNFRYKQEYPDASLLYIYWLRLAAQLNIARSKIARRLWRQAQEQFIFRGETFFYTRVDYNNSAVNERSVEIPIFSKMVSESLPKRILEVGFVLGHYTQSTWDTVDLCEQGERVINKDILNFYPESRYDLIISISTLEHISFDYGHYESRASLTAIRHLLTSCLTPSGELIFTAPLGYNKEMDEFILSRPCNTWFLQRTDLLNRWKEVPRSAIGTVRYGSPFNNANAIAIVRLSHKEGMDREILS